MTKAKIGISMYGNSPDEYFNLPKEYVHAVITAGAIPYLLPPSTLAASEVLAGLDGLILAGGGDIHPSVYQGEHHEMLYNIDPLRDAAELALAEYVIQESLPCFAICRGFQIINVCQGGTLHEHLVDHYGETVKHREAPHAPVNHDISIRAESKLADIIQQDSITVSSWHHQAIKELGKNLEVVTQTADQVIEAIEMPSHPWLLGVQWHPEHSAAEDPVQQNLFNSFIEFINSNK